MKYCKIKGKDTIYEVQNTCKNTIFLRNKNMLIKTDVNNVEYVSEVPHKSVSGKTSIILNNEAIPQEIMLRHLTREEAMEKLDRYIDKAISNGLGRVRIIHGRHGSVLKNATHEYLKNHPNVIEYYLASPAEGDIGVTVAIISKKQKN